MENLNFIIAKNLCELRKKNKLTQLEVAEKLNYSDKAVSKWEQGESMPSIEVLYKLSHLYNVSLDYIVGDEKSPKEKVVSKKTNKKRLIITLLSIVAVWLVSFVLYTTLDIFGDIDIWMLFCWSIPVSIVVAIVFDCIWNKHRLMFVLISVLIWSTLLCIFVQFFSYNVWKILLIGIPLQIATFLWYKLIK